MMPLLNKYMSPGGERMLWMVILFAFIGAFLYLRHQYLRWMRVPLRIKKKIWYSGGLKMAVNVRNTGKTIAEISAPEIEFRQPHMSRRRFKIVAPGDVGIFPLGLTPQTGYDFLVEFTKLYEREPVLRKYTRVMILIKDRKGTPVIRKKVKISLPK